MLPHMDPSSPPDKRTLHLLKIPDILCANDNRKPGSYRFINIDSPSIQWREDPTENILGRSSDF